MKAPACQSPGGRVTDLTQPKIRHIIAPHIFLSQEKAKKSAPPELRRRAKILYMFYTLRYPGNQADIAPPVPAAFLFILLLVVFSNGVSRIVSAEICL